jgi:TonB family protein
MGAMMRKTIQVFLLFSLLATAPSFVEAAQKSKKAAGKAKAVDPIFRKIKIPPGTIELTEPELRKAATKRVVPEYPDIGCSTRVVGDVAVAILVDKNGKVIDAGAISGPALLRQAAIGTAKKWEFQPFLKDDHPVKFTGTLTFRFNLGS